ncbi:hypothetical protein [Bordetella sp. LUAb4]|uniref:hypothetical protein n=1 Tax=Bordetella sp. LUAb4 TaxID=2843195 RepID=UPI001E318E19|nr:hypothetical protein [Bordetella sp. LUAb4]
MTSSFTVAAADTAASYHSTHGAVAPATDPDLPRLAGIDSARQSLAAANAAALLETYAATPPVFVTSDFFESVPLSVDAFDEGLRAGLDDLVAHMDKLVLKRIDVVYCVGRIFFRDASARAQAVKQYLLSKGVEDPIQVGAEYSFGISPPSQRLARPGAVEVRVGGMLPQPPRRDPTLWALPPVLLKSMPEAPEAFDEDLNQRLDHAVRDFRDTGVSRIEVSIVSPMIEENSASLVYLGKAYLVTAHLVKDAVIARGQDAATVFVKPLANLRLARPALGAISYGVLIEAWSPRPDPMPRLAWTEGYVPELRA